jgi:hypothetical protein
MLALRGPASDDRCGTMKDESETKRAACGAIRSAARLHQDASSFITLYSAAFASKPTPGTSGMRT